MRFIGDVHGWMDNYVLLTTRCEESIQVGDMGAGFVKLRPVSLKHRFIRGNHDDPEICRKSKNWIPDGTFENGMFFLGGARSIDQHRRIMGVSWWPEEELSWKELKVVIHNFQKIKPNIVVTHDCPKEIALKLNSHHQDDNSKTREALDAMLLIHKPKLWVFGHNHIDFDQVINSTRFICLDELSFVDIDIEEFL